MAKRKATKKKHNDCWNTIGVWSSVPEKCERLSQVVHCRNCDVFSQAGREVLERTPPGGYVTQWRKEIAHQQGESDTTLTGVMTFRIAEEWFAVPAKTLQEIAEQRTIHRVPHNDNPHVVGIVNIGGEVDICYSLGDFLGLSKQANVINAYERLMVVIYNGDRYIFPVNEVSGMTRYGEADVLPVPATLGGDKSSYVDGMFVMGKTHIAILNIEQICQTLEGAAA